MRELVLEHWDLLNSLSRQRFPDTNLSDEALLFVLAALEAADWQKVRAFQGKASFATYLSHVTWRLLEDFARKKFGRPRPPKWVKAQGSLWEEVYRLLCLERRSAASVVENLASGQAGKHREIVGEAVDVILSRISDCGRRNDEIPATQAAQEFADTQPFYLSPENLYMARQRVLLIESLGRYFTGGASLEDIDQADRWTQILVTRLKGCVDLIPEDQLFLKLIYQEGLTVSAAGGLLGYSSHQAHGRQRRLLARLRAAFKNAGLDQELKDWLN
jgi:hypothetical protein